MAVLTDGLFAGAATSGLASQRPFSYFTYANLAAYMIGCSGCWRSLSPVPSESSLGGRGPWTGCRIVARAGAIVARVCLGSGRGPGQWRRWWPHWL